MMQTDIRVLALCGSLRAQSRSRVLLEAAALLAPQGMVFSIYPTLADLPLFNPDLESAAPDAVHNLWEAVAQADAMVIASPEYAHGVTGVIKNALDWLVGCIPFAYMPMAVWNPSHRASHADLALKETLQTMAASLIADACARIPVTRNTLDAATLIQDPVFVQPLQAVLQAIVSASHRQ